MDGGVESSPFANGLILNAAPIAGRRVAVSRFLGSPNHQRPRTLRNAAHGEFLAQRLDQRELRIRLHERLSAAVRG
jgi:hypothetical protein